MYKDLPNFHPLHFSSFFAYRMTCSLLSSLSTTTFNGLGLSESASGGSLFPSLMTFSTLTSFSFSSSSIAAICSKSLSILSWCLSHRFSDAVDDNACFTLLKFPFFGFVFVVTSKPLQCIRGRPMLTENYCLFVWLLLCPPFVSGSVQQLLACDSHWFPYF